MHDVCALLYQKKPFLHFVNLRFARMIPSFAVCTASLFTYALLSYRQPVPCAVSRGVREAISTSRPLACTGQHAEADAREAALQQRVRRRERVHFAMLSSLARAVRNVCVHRAAALAVHHLGDSLLHALYACKDTLLCLCMCCLCTSHFSLCFLRVSGTGSNKMNRKWPCPPMN